VQLAASSGPKPSVYRRTSCGGCSRFWINISVTTASLATRTYLLGGRDVHKDKKSSIAEWIVPMVVWLAALGIFVSLILALLKPAGW
jgi:hypothetical protein